MDNTIQKVKGLGETKRKGRYSAICKIHPDQSLYFLLPPSQLKVRHCITSLWQQLSGKPAEHQRGLGMHFLLSCFMCLEAIGSSSSPPYKELLWTDTASDCVSQINKDTHTCTYVPIILQRTLIHKLTVNDFVQYEVGGLQLYLTCSKGKQSPGVKMS